MTEQVIDFTKVTRQFQVTLTSEVRKELGVNEGDRVAFVKKGNEVVIRKA